MTFIILSSIIMFAFSSFAWLGGLLFVSGVLIPIAKHDNSYEQTLFIESIKRFYGISVMCLWTMFATGLIILATNQKYFLFRFEEDIDYLYVLLEIIFISVSIFNFLIGNHLRAIENNPKDTFDFHFKNIFRFIKANIYLGIIFLIIFSSMVYYG